FELRLHPITLRSCCDPSQPRGSLRPPARQAVHPAAEAPDAPEVRAAALAAVEDLVAPAKLREGLRHRGVAGAGAELRGQPPEERSVGGAPAFQAIGPGLSRLVAPRVLALDLRQVRRDRDRVGTTVPDLAAGELAPRQGHPRRVEAESRRQAIVETLEAFLFAEGFDLEETAHPRRHPGAVGSRRQKAESRRQSATGEVCLLPTAFCLLPLRTAYFLFLYQSALTCW